ncbi:MAG TPA: hypothetical protein VF250_16825 [Conexibacter sp.]
MFERIARRQADRPGESDDQATAEVPVGDQPTERMDPVEPAPSASQAVQPPAAPPTEPPPPTIDLTTRLAPIAAPATPPVVAEPAPRRPGFRARGRMRRRLRYLRKLRELQVRDLGGLVFDLRRFERKRDDLLAQKLDQIRACDDELRALEQALDERRDLRDVREPGIGGTCPRCFAIYGSADKFCSNCGAAFGGAVQGPAAQVPLAPPPAPASPQSAGSPEASGPDGPGPQA